MTQALLEPPVRTGARADLVVPRSGLKKGELDKFKKRLLKAFEEVLQIWPRLDIQLMSSAMLRIATREPLIVQATMSSLVGFLLRAAETNLLIDEELSAIVDQNVTTREVTIAPVEMVRGIVKMMRAAGARDVSSGTVYEHDKFVHNFEDGVREFEFVPNLYVRDRGRVICYFAVVDLPQHRWFAKVHTVKEVLELRRVSTNPEHPAWRNYPHRMGELTALRAASEWIPQVHLRPRALEVQEIIGSTRDLGKQAPREPRRASASNYAASAAPLTLTEALDMVLPGTAEHFSGWGGVRLALCPDDALRKAGRWITEDTKRQAKYPRLFAAITLVLTDRASARPNSGSPS